MLKFWNAGDSLLVSETPRLFGAEPAQIHKNLRPRVTQLAERNVEFQPSPGQFV